MVQCSELYKYFQDYDYDKKLKDSNRDLNMLRAQAAALSGNNNQAAQAELARLNAQIAEQEESLRDTILDHQYDMQNQGYDKLSEDANKILDDTIKALERETELADATINNMLEKTKGHWAEIYGEDGVIDNLLSHTGTTVGSMANEMLTVTQETFKQIQESAKIKVEFTVDASQVAKAINDTKIQMGYGDKGTNGTVANIEAEISGNADKKVNTNTLNTIPKEPDKVKSSGEIDQSLRNPPKQTTTATTTQKTNTSTQTGSANDGYKAFVALINSQQKGTTKKTDVLSKYLSSELNVLELAQGKATELAKLVGVTSGKGIDVVNALKKNGWVDKLKKERTDSNMKSAIDAAIKAAPKHSKTLTAKEKKDHVELWQYIATKYGKEANQKFYEALQKALGLSGKLDNAMKTKMLNLLKQKGYSGGASNIKEDELNWTHDGEIIRRSDGAILRQLNASTQVFPKDQAENLWKISQIDPSIIKKMVEETDTSKFMPKLKGYTGAETMASTQSINIHYDSLLTVNGNVDKDALPGLQEILKRSYEYTTQQMTREARKAGMRR